jgi:hypothetical protein
MRRIGLAVVLTFWMKEDIMRMLSGFLALVDWPSNGRRRERGGGRVGHARPRFAWGPVDPWGPPRLADASGAHAPEPGAAVSSPGLDL